MSRRSSRRPRASLSRASRAFMRGAAPLNAHSGARIARTRHEVALRVEVCWATRGDADAPGVADARRARASTACRCMTYLVTRVAMRAGGIARERFGEASSNGATRGRVGWRQSKRQNIVCTTETKLSKLQGECKTIKTRVLEPWCRRRRIRRSCRRLLTLWTAAP